MTDPSIRTPARRPLKIFAFDPMYGRLARNRVSVDIPNETLLPGPRGSRVEVLDHDATNRRRYAPVDLDDPRILMQGGLDPTESHPWFHQQMVYAVVMRVIENFELALGRRWRFLKNNDRVPLTVHPHALQERNAYFDDDLHALLFGYFRADDRDVGANLPGGTVFTCLSHDIVAHEATHAMVHTLRPRLLEPTNHDVLAFHEGFADLVAILQHFTFRDVLEHQLADARGDLGATGPLLELGGQFGFATGRGKALRSAIGDSDGKVAAYDPGLEPHALGRILVEAVFDAFLQTYRARTADLVRIATGGSGVLPAGALHPDLVTRLADEAARTAQNVLTMCIRAFEYLPPVDVTFGDFLRALVTADSDAVPDDPLEQRNALIEGFRRRGIIPSGVSSLAVEALRWPAFVGSLPPVIAPEEMARLLHQQALAFDAPESSDAKTPAQRQDDKTLGQALHAYARAHREALGLAAGLPIHVAGWHVSQGWTRDRRFVAQAVIQLVQTVPATQVPERGGLPLRGGSTIVTDASGSIRYLIAKPLQRVEAGPGARGSRPAWLGASDDGWHPMPLDGRPPADSARWGTAHLLRRLHVGIR